MSIEMLNKNKEKMLYSEDIARIDDDTITFIWHQKATTCNLYLYLMLKSKE